jgi:tryptophan synthase alpha chain
MDRVAACFQARRRAAFMPFFTAGDPDYQTTLALVKTAAAHGADLIEIGVPFSDPIADGPAIQASYYRALKAGFKVDQFFRLIEELRASGVELPLAGMVSHPLVVKRTVDAFVARAARAGLDALIIPDLPAGYEQEARDAARHHGLHLVYLCAPTTTPERRAQICAGASGFLYYISVAGITGTRANLPSDLVANVTDLKSRTATPVCVGFGISEPEQAAAVAAVADGVIVGSALVKDIAARVQAGEPLETLCAGIGQRVAALAQATHGA